MVTQTEAYAYLRFDDGWEPLDHAVAAVQEADLDEVPHVLCGAACLIAAAGGPEAAAELLRAIDESRVTLKGWTTPAVHAATALDRVLGLELEWFAQREPLLDEFERAAADHWTHLPLPSGDWRDLAGDALLRRGLLLAREGEVDDAREVLRAYLGANRAGWTASKARRVLIGLLAEEGSDEVIDVLAEEVRESRSLALMAEVDLCRTVIRERALVEVVGVNPASVPDAMAALLEAARARLSTGQASAAIGWTEVLSRWIPAMRRYVDREGLSELVAAPLELRPGADEVALRAAERRLDIVLPPSYRSFLAVTNGLSVIGRHFLGELFAVDAITWFSEGNQEWIDAYTTGDDTVVPDEQYFVYGASQDCMIFRPAYLRTALQISEVADGVVWLLMPEVVGPDAEWEAWEFSDDKPGADRFRSFAGLVEYQMESLT